MSCYEAFRSAVVTPRAGMHVFLPVYFTAPLGGVQAQVRAHVRGLLSEGHQCTVLARPGQFLEDLSSAGATVLETDWSSFGAALDVARRGGYFDLVHAHPARSREVGLEIAREQKLPFVLTIHGTYLDALASYSTRVDAVVAVSQAARDHIIAADVVEPERVLVIPNGADIDRLRMLAQHRRDEVDLGAEPLLEEAEGRARILLVSRLDPDKRAVIEAVESAWEGTTPEMARRVLWLVAGDGRWRDRLESAARKLEHRTRCRSVVFLGWQSETELSSLYRRADLTVAPGRCVIDALACGSPVLALGSKGYAGPAMGSSGLRGVYGNFGGFEHRTHSPEQLLADVDRLTADPEGLATARAAAAEVAEAMYDQAQVDRTHRALYELIRADAPLAQTAPHEWRELTPSGLDFRDRWATLHSPRGFDLTNTDDSLVATCDLESGRAVYFTGIPTDLEIPPDDGRLAVGGNRMLQLVLTLRVDCQAPDIRAWLIEYAGNRRVTHRSAVLMAGETRIATATSSETTQIRIAIRFAGRGRATLGPLRLLTCAEEAQSAYESR